MERCRSGKELMEGEREGTTGKDNWAEKGRVIMGQANWKLGKVTERWRTGLPPSEANDDGRWLGVGHTIRSQYHQFVTRHTNKVADAFVHRQQ